MSRENCVNRVFSLQIVGSIAKILLTVCPLDSKFVSDLLGVKKEILLYAGHGNVFLSDKFFSQW